MLISLKAKKEPPARNEWIRLTGKPLKVTMETYTKGRNILKTIFPSQKITANKNIRKIFSDRKTGYAFACEATDQ